jgi:hypothetical protein
MTTALGTFPVQLSADDATTQNRLTVFFRLILIIPHAIVLGILGIVASIIYLISWFAILFTGGYPAGLYRFMAGFLRWTARINSYFYLLTDRYPPFSLSDDENYPVRLLVDEQTENRNRLTTFWPIRWILAIPHLIIVGALGYAAGVVVIIAWFAALITGSVPAGLHNFLAGYLRWYFRTYAYVFLLTDDYPPFALN